MITKSELQNAYREQHAERAASEPPTAEEVLAYVQGELSGDEEGRVRERLLAHPDMLRAAISPFPSDDARPGDADYLPDDQVAKQWRAFQPRRFPVRPARILPWRIATALAASIALAVGGLLWQSESTVRLLTNELAQPRLGGHQLLAPDGRRGAGDVQALSARGDSYVLDAPIVGEPYDRYRLELVDVGNGRTLWGSDPQPRPEGETFVLIVPRARLHSGTFRVVLYGINGPTAQPVATYSFAVPAS